MAGKDAAEKDGAEAKGGGKMKIIIAAVVVLALAGGGYWFFLKPKEDPGPVTLPKPVPGAVIAVDPITINLAGGHFLKIGLGLQPIAGVAEAPTGEKALDLAIDQFSGKTVAELSSTEGREKNKEELVARIKLAYLGETAEAELEKQAEEAGGEASTEEGSEEEGSTEEEAEEKLTGEQAVEKANALTVQPEVYDVYFTEFVMQ